MSTTDLDPTCPFCRIVAGDEAATIVARSARVIAFAARDAVARVHVVVAPTWHLEAGDVLFQGAGLLRWRTLSGGSDLLRVVAQVVRETGIDATGFRLVANAGADAGQAARHLHLHVLGGQSLGPIAS